MNTEDFNYNLPEELIAQAPVSPRDHSRLLILTHTDADNANSHRSLCIENCHCEPSSLLKTKQSTLKIASSQILRNEMKIEHRHFYDIIDYLKPGDLLIMNDTKVFPARLIGEKEYTHGIVEIFLNKEIDKGVWECLGRKLKIGARIIFANSDLRAIVLNKKDDVFSVRFNMSGESFSKAIEKIGLTPLPPYIKRTKELKNSRTKELDKDLYQTVYAKERGSVAAPTAGLHFTEELLENIRNKGVFIEYVTLHVGLGTFAPVKVDRIEEHKIHQEFYSVNRDVVEKIIKAKCEGHRIIAVGTTTVRTLETIFNNFHFSIFNFQLKSKVQALRKSQNGNGCKLEAKSYFGWTDIFIYPGYKFKCVDAIVTNFHLPKSSLLMLVSAFAGKKNIDKAYEEAIEHKYRFYSYGDAMLIQQFEQ